MSLEVEQKFRVEDLSQLLHKLAHQSIELGDSQLQRDAYFNHPAKDFAQTDEALRIRSLGQENRVTYKGPKRSAKTKARREIEFKIASGEEGRQQFQELLEALQFRHVKTVEKNRRHGSLAFHDWDVQIAVDQIAGLGDFVELEITARDDQLHQAEQALLALAELLELSDVERRSYLEMSLAAGT